MIKSNLVGNPTEEVNGLDRSTSGTSTGGIINNTGGFAANGDQGFIGTQNLNLQLVCQVQHPVIVDS